ncbi:hypothetical protein [Actinoplanes sp. NPDC049599]|uniref:hypothetical protein n=1 Tax=Actinoplanes sp. NPDC049599 TaxID=3363903 RepID=UPI003790694F
MTITDNRVAGFQTALRGLATATDRFAGDPEATRAMAEAIQSGDAGQVTQALERLGAGTVAYGGRKPRPHFDEDPAPTHIEVFRLVPPDSQRWPVEIEVSISVKC